MHGPSPKSQLRAAGGLVPWALPAGIMERECPMHNQRTGMVCILLGMKQQTHPAPEPTERNAYPNKENGKKVLSKILLLVP